MKTLIVLFVVSLTSVGAGAVLNCYGYPIGIVAEALGAYGVGYALGHLDALIASHQWPYSPRKIERMALSPWKEVL